MLSWKAERQYFGTRGSFRNRAKTGVNATKPPLMTRSASHCALEREQHHAGPSPAVRMFERSQVVARLISFRYGEKAREVACQLERLGQVRFAYRRSFELPTEQRHPLNGQRLRGDGTNVRRSSAQGAVANDRSAPSQEARYVGQQRAADTIERHVDGPVRK